MARIPRLKDFLRNTFELQDPQNARLLSMEGLRGFAVLLVFLQHFSLQSQLIGLSSGPAQSFAAVFRDYGNFGVELFFVLSGFLIYGTLIRKSPPFFVFMLRRIQRIYPAFLVVFGLATLMTFVLPIPGKMPNEVGQAALFLAANLALLPGLFPIVPIVDVAWSLSYEMFFYIATAGLVLGMRTHLANKKLRVTVLGVLTAAFLLSSHANLDWFPVRMMPFFAGMLLAEGIGILVPAWAGWLLPGVAFLGLCLRIPYGPYGELIHTLSFFSLCAVCFRKIGIVTAVMTWTPLRWLGNMSYSYYLVHGFVVRIFMLGLARLLPHGMSELTFWTILPALFAGTILASALLFIFVERPFSLHSSLSKRANFSSNWAATEKPPDISTDEGLKQSSNEFSTLVNVLASSKAISAEKMD